MGKSRIPVVFNLLFFSLVVRIDKILCVLSHFTRVQLFQPYGLCSLPASSVHGLLQARIQEWDAMPSSRGSSWPRDQTRTSCASQLAGRFFTAEPPRKPILSTRHAETGKTQSLPLWSLYILLGYLHINKSGMKWLQIQNFSSLCPYLRHNIA